MFPGIGALPEPATGSHVVTRGQRSAPRKCNQPAARRSAHGSVQRSSQENGALCFCLCLFVLLPVIVAGDAAAPPQPAQPSARRGPSVCVECLIGKQKKSRSIEVVSNGFFFEGVFRSFLREFFGLHLSVASVLLLQFTEVEYPLLRACSSSSALRAAGLHTHVHTHRTSSDPAYLIK